MKKKIAKAAKRLDKAVPRGALLHEKVARVYAGKYATPTGVAKKMKTDRAYGCRTLQRLVQLGRATLTERRGTYYVMG